MKITVELRERRFPDHKEVSLEFRDDYGEIYTLSKQYDKNFEKELLPRNIDTIFYEAKKAVKERLISQQQD